MIKTTFNAGLLAVGLAVAAAGPAAAGSFSLTVAPGHDNADLIRTGLEIYSLSLIHI